MEGYAAVALLAVKLCSILWFSCRVVLIVTKSV